MIESNYIGIDPGVDGAVVVLDGSNDIIEVYDLECHVNITGTGKKRREFDFVRFKTFLYLLKKNNPDIDFRVTIERPLAMRNVGGEEKGAISAASQFQIYGEIRATVSALGLSYQTIYPMAWKRSYKLISNKKLGIKITKKDSLKKAIEIWPNQAEYFSRVKDNNRADAALIGLRGVALWERGV